MAWFWNAYLPDVAKRVDIHVSPLNASLEQLRDLPPRWSSPTRTTCCATRVRPMVAS
jgi:acetyl esterase/lipase